MPVLRTARLTLRQMTADDLDDMAALLGHPAVMRFYPAPKSREEARAWIAWTTASYAEHGYGLWVVQTRAGEFVGDCGLTVQQVEGRQEVEVGYHVRADLQGRGFATEAAAACRDHAVRLGVERLVAIVDPANLPSQRVAAKIGLELERTVPVHGGQKHLYASPDGAPFLRLGSDHAPAGAVVTT